MGTGLLFPSPLAFQSISLSHTSPASLLSSFYPVSALLSYRQPALPSHPAPSFLSPSSCCLLPSQSPLPLVALPCCTGEMAAPKSCIAHSCTSPEPQEKRKHLVLVASSHCKHRCIFISQNKKDRLSEPRGPSLVVQGIRGGAAEFPSTSQSSVVVDELYVSSQRQVAFLLSWGT